MLKKRFKVQQSLSMISKENIKPSLKFVIIWLSDLALFMVSFDSKKKFRYKTFQYKQTTSLLWKIEIIGLKIPIEMNPRNSLICLIWSLWVFATNATWWKEVSMSDRNQSDGQISDWFLPPSQCQDNTKYGKDNLLGMCLTNWQQERQTIENYFQTKENKI